MRNCSIGSPVWCEHCGSAQHNNRPAAEWYEAAGGSRDVGVPRCCSLFTTSLCSLLWIIHQRHIRLIHIAGGWGVSWLWAPCSLITLRVLYGLSLYVSTFDQFMEEGRWTLNNAVLGSVSGTADGTRSLVHNGPLTLIYLSAPLSLSLVTG